VVEGGSTEGGVEDTRLVLLEDWSVGLNGNRDNSLLDGSLQLGEGSLGNIVVGGGIHSSLWSRVVLAGSVSGGVWVIRLEDGIVSLEPEEGSGHGSSIATRGNNFITINELLLSELEKISGPDGVLSLHSSHGGESPA